METECHDEEQADEEDSYKYGPIRDVSHWKVPTIRYVRATFPQQ